MESFNKLPAGKSVEAQAEKVDWQQAFNHGWRARAQPAADVDVSLSVCCRLCCRRRGRENEG